MSELGWRHHALIQALLSRGPLSEHEFHLLFTGVTGKNPAKSKDLFHNTLLKINKELSYVQFELRGCRDQYDGKVYYGVINNVSDEQSQLGTKYSVPQIAFYKAVIEAITQDMTGQGCISNIDALNVRLDIQVQATQTSEDSQSQVPYAVRAFSMSQKEKTLNDLIKDKWLSSTSSGKVGLGVRSFLDLRSWFRTNGYPSCSVCNEPAVKATSCPNEQCTIRIHAYCLRKKFSQRKTGRNCVGCNTEWPPLNCDNGEEEEQEEVQDESHETQAIPVASTSKRRPRSFKATAEEAVQSQNQGNVPQKKKLRSCKAEEVRASQAGGGPPLSSQPSPRRTRTRSFHIG